MPPVMAQRCRVQTGSPHPERTHHWMFSFLKMILFLNFKLKATTLLFLKKQNKNRQCFEQKLAETHSHQCLRQPPEGQTDSPQSRYGTPMSFPHGQGEPPGWGRRHPSRGQGTRTRVGGGARTGGVSSGRVYDPGDLTGARPAGLPAPRAPHGDSHLSLQAGGSRRLPAAGACAVSAGTRGAGCRRQGFRGPRAPMARRHNTVFCSGFI